MRGCDFRLGGRWRIVRLLVKSVPRGRNAVGIALLLVTALLPTGRAEVSSADLAALFRPARISQVRLAPDGRHLAYTVRDGTVTSIVIREVDHPQNKVTVFADVDAVRGFFSRTVTARVGVTFLDWADADTLVYSVSLPPKNNAPRDEVCVVNASGRGNRTLVDADFLETLYQPPIVLPPPSRNVQTAAASSSSDQATLEQSAPVLMPRRGRAIGFDPTVPGTVFVEADGIITTVYRTDLRTGKSVRVSELGRDTPILVDAHGQPRLTRTSSHEPSAADRVGASDNDGIAAIDPNLHALMSSLRRDSHADEIVPQRYEYWKKSWFGDWGSFNRLGAGIQAQRFDAEEADSYEPHSIPLGFGTDNDVLYFGSNVGRDTYGIYAINLSSGQRTDLAVEDDSCDLVDPGDAFNSGRLVFDRARRLRGVRVAGPKPTTRWFDPTLATLQVRLESQFPGREVDIESWDEAMSRFLVWISGYSDPGRYFMYESQQPMPLVEFLRQSAAVSAERVAVTQAFSFVSSEGVSLNGSVTLARSPRVDPPPLLVWCRDLPGDRLAGPAFDPPVQAFAAMGFQVLTVDYRGTAGHGTRFRDAVHADIDGIPLADIRAAMAWIAPRFRFDPRRVAFAGEGFGGYLALRATELFPSAIRCAVSIDGPTDLAAWVGRTGVKYDPRTDSPTQLRRRRFFGDDQRHLTAISLEAGKLLRPVFLVETAGEPLGGKELRATLVSAGRTADFISLPRVTDGAYDGSLPKAFDRIQDFLNDVLFSYRVEIGPEEVK